MPAFEGAVRLGYRYLETDVHATADGVLVAFHDSRLDRVTDRAGVIAELPWSEVRLAKVDGREPIALLEDLLGAFPEARLNIDAKADSSVAPLIETLRRTNAVERVCIGAFSDRRLRRIRCEVGPTLCTSMGPREVARLRMSGWRIPLGAPDVPCAQVPVRQGPVRIVDDRFVRTAHAHGIAVHVWTVDEEAEMEELIALGVDGIMTDRPTRLRSVLERHDLWRSGT
jgi:glycerophosphoryl diester phosphodiesterase